MTTLNTLFNFFENATKFSSSAKLMLKQYGIDSEQIPIGWINSRFHQNASIKKNSSLLAYCEEVGLLKKGVRGYTIAYPNSLVFACRDSENHIVDLFVYSADTENGHYLLGQGGFFPKKPQESEELYIAYDVIEAAQVLSETPEESVLALHSGELNSHLLGYLRKVQHHTSFTWSEKISKAERQKLEVSTDELPYTLTEKDTHLVFAMPPVHIDIMGDRKELDLKEHLSFKLYQQSQPIRAVRHSFSLYHPESTLSFIQAVHEKLHFDTEQIQQVLDYLTFALEQYIQSATSLETKVVVNPKRKSKALAYLHDENLMKCLDEDLGSIGLVGERMNRLLAFLVMTSRKLPNPLHLINYGKSGMGKSMLLDMIGLCMPPEDQIELSSISSKALYHLQSNQVQHKVLLLQDLYAINQEVLYQIRELQSKKKLSRKVTVKTKQGQFETRMQVIHGPVCVVGSTTADRVYHDNSNRSLEIYMDESSEQDERILTRQRASAAGLINLEAERRKRLLLQDCGRLLQTMSVHIPYAQSLQLPGTILSKRRTNSLYLGLIEAITLLHQYQRERETDRLSGMVYVKSTPQDAFWAHKLLQHVIIHKADLLNPACRNFFEEVKAWVGKTDTASFTSKDIVHGLRMPVGTVKRHLKVLRDYGFLSAHGQPRSGYQYRIANTVEFDELNLEIGQVFSDNNKRIGYA